VLVILAGQAIRAAVIGLAYIQRGGKNGKVHAEELVHTGIFAHVRNPLYLGNFLAQLGLYVIHNSPWVYAIGLTFTLVSYRAIVATEETYLRRRFGAVYEDYCRRVPRWLPALRGLRSTLSALRFRWRRVLFKEHTSTYTGVTGVVALFVYQALAEPPFSWRPYYFLALGILLAAGTVAWAVVHHRKKTKGRNRHGRKPTAPRGTRLDSAAIERAPA
jgi:protein-S-isoprenylcysteine O-methyltransferase Ste14